MKVPVILSDINHQSLEVFLRLNKDILRWLRVNCRCLALTS